jgi:hypothetical protein
VEQLRSILGSHPHFADLEIILREGMTYRFHAQHSKAERCAELTAMVEIRNHKSAENEPDVVNKLLLKDVTHRFSPPYHRKRLRSFRAPSSSRWDLENNGP